ncbi:hypothetical protein H6P81_017976 [Aristolochia fimbriata]|uniref:Uncharacterized protein n=1 Tax=Aristolochia fimbriata TaxID=158543 RepID=A0AAV7E3Z5_ARIFI|nr:hypothetical protein H6P81_017976 [Aristolochia fimbriata]
MADPTRNVALVQHSLRGLTTALENYQVSAIKRFHASFQEMKSLPTKNPHPDTHEQTLISLSWRKNESQRGHGHIFVAETGEVGKLEKTCAITKNTLMRIVFAMREGTAIFLSLKLEKLGSWRRLVRLQRIRGRSQYGLCWAGIVGPQAQLFTVGTLRNRGNASRRANLMRPLAGGSLVGGPQAGS